MLTAQVLTAIQSGELPYFMARDLCYIGVILYSHLPLIIYAPYSIERLSFAEWVG